MESGNDIKRSYVDAAYELISVVGMEGVTAREIARIVKKSPPAIYRHFPSVDYLAAVASARSLGPYYEALEALVPSLASSLDVNIQTWECFAFYAFQNVPMYENLFLNGGFEERNPIEDYFELFPEDKFKMKEYLIAPVRSVDLRERDAYMLNRAVEEGFIKKDAVDYLADCDELLLRGLFQERRNAKMGEDQIYELTRKFIGLLYRNYSNCLLPGKHIMEDFKDRYDLN